MKGWKETAEQKHGRIKGDRQTRRKVRDCRQQTKKGGRYIDVSTIGITEDRHGEK